MRNRRDFIKTVAGATAGAFVMSGSVADLVAQGYEVQVVADCVSSRESRNRDIALKRIQAEGARLTTCEMTIYELLKTAENPKFREILQIIK